MFLHWRAAVSGFGALVVSAVVQWKGPGWWPWAWPWAPITPDDPRFWWIVAGCCFALAMFQAWLDEHRARVTAEGRGPRLVLEFREDDDLRRQGHRWRITNTGSVDAVNVTSDDITVGDATVNIERIALLRPGQSEEVSFNQRIGANPIGHARHPQYLLEDQLKKEVAARYTGADFVEHLANCRLRIRLSFFDPAGIEYASRGTIRWNGVIDKAYVEPVSWGIAMPMPWWRRWFNRLRRRGAVPSLVASIIIVVAISSTASAECAWVLWMRETSFAFGVFDEKPWQLIRAAPTFDACEAAQAETIKNLAKFWGKGRDAVDVSASGNIFTLSMRDAEGKPAGFTNQFFRCLPDTVDPRGPKAGGR